MYIGREIAEHQDWYLGSTATSSVLSNPSAWIGIAILLYLLVFCGRTTRLVVLGMLAVPVVALALFLGVPYVTVSLFGEGLTSGQRTVLAFGSMGLAWWAFWKWLDRSDSRQDKNEDGK